MRPGDQDIFDHATSLLPAGRPMLTEPPREEPPVHASSRPTLKALLERARCLAKAIIHAPKGSIGPDGTPNGGQFVSDHGFSIDKGPAGGSTLRITKTQAEAIKHGMDSMMKAVKTRRDVRNACLRGRDGIEQVDFLWGDEGAGPPEFFSGWGIAKEIAKRDFEHKRNPDDPGASETLMSIPMVIVLGEIQGNPQRGKQERITLGYRIKQYWYEVTLVRNPLDKSKGPNHWILTGFENPQKRLAPVGTGEAYDSSSPTTDGPTRFRSIRGAGAGPSMVPPPPPRKREK